MPRVRQTGTPYARLSEPNENYDPLRGPYFCLRSFYYERRKRGGRTQRHHDANRSPSDSSPSRTLQTSQSRILIRKRFPCCTASGAGCEADVTAVDANPFPKTAKVKHPQRRTAIL